MTLILFNDDPKGQSSEAGNLDAPKRSCTVLRASENVNVGDSYASITGKIYNIESLVLSDFRWVSWNIFPVQESDSLAFLAARYLRSAEPCRCGRIPCLPSSRPQVFAAAGSSAMLLTPSTCQTPPHLCRTRLRMA